MEESINILKDHIRKDEKRIRWYKRNGYEKAANSLQESVDNLNLSINFIMKGFEARKHDSRQLT